MTTIRNVLTSSQIGSKDSAEDLIIQMWEIVDMGGSRLIREVEKYESFHKKRDVVAHTISSIPKTNTPVMDYGNINPANLAPTNPSRVGAHSIEMANLTLSSPSLEKSSISIQELSPGSGDGGNSIVRKKNYI